MGGDVAGVGEEGGVFGDVAGEAVTDDLDEPLGDVAIPGQVEAVAIAVGFVEEAEELGVLAGAALPADVGRDAVLPVKGLAQAEAELLGVLGDAGDELVVLDRGGRVGGGDEGEEAAGDGVDAVGGDDVVGEGEAGKRIVKGDGDVGAGGGEVARAFEGGGDRGDAVEGVAAVGEVVGEAEIRRIADDEFRDFEGATEDGVDAVLGLVGTFVLEAGEGVGAGVPIGVAGLEG